MSNQLPVAVIGAGPVGLAAAAHLLAAGEEPLLLEAGPAAGRHVGRVGPRAALLAVELQRRPGVAPSCSRRHGWADPPADEHPTGHELVDRYLAPLAAIARDRRPAADLHPGDGGDPGRAATG